MDTVALQQALFGTEKPARNRQRGGRRPQSAGLPRTTSSGQEAATRRWSQVASAEVLARPSSASMRWPRRHHAASAWLPAANRVAQVGEGTAAPHRLNKTVARLSLSKMRTSCQVNYPETVSKHNVGLCIDGPPKVQPKRTEVDHMRPPKPKHLRPTDIRRELVRSFVGNRSGRYSDWLATSPKAKHTLDDSVEMHLQKRASRLRASRSRRRKIVENRPPLPKTPSSNRHGRVASAIRAQVEETRATDQADNVVIIPGTIMKRSELASLQQTSGFGTGELRKVMQAFNEHASREPDSKTSGTVNLEQFVPVIQEIFDGTTEEMACKLFTSMDNDGSGTVDYKELIQGCAKMVKSASTHDKYKLIFEAYSSDGGDTISVSDLMRLTQQKGVEMKESLHLVQNIMSTIDTDGSGRVGCEEFLGACEDAPVLLHAFEGLLPSPALFHDHLDQLHSASGGYFDWDRLKDLSAFLHERTAIGGVAEVTSASFRSLMHEFFDYNDPVLTGNMFDAIDRDKSGLVDFKELLTGLSSALAGSPQQKMDFYFSLYDMDGSGAIDETEIYRLLERGHETSQHMSGGSAAKMLEEHGLASLDADGDGHVSHEEFLRAVKEHPGALNLFGPVVH